MSVLVQIAHAEAALTGQSLSYQSISQLRASSIYFGSSNNAPESFGVSTTLTEVGEHQITIILDGVNNQFGGQILRFGDSVSRMFANIYVEYAVKLQKDGLQGKALL